PPSGRISDHSASGVPMFGAPHSGGGPGHSILFRLRPLIVSLAGVALGAGVAAFQIFETMQAQRLSLRQQMTYEYFSGASFAPTMIWRSFITPIHHFNHEASAYVAPLSAVFALVAVIGAMRAPARRLRVYFWLLVAALGLLLMMGDHTPL